MTPKDFQKTVDEFVQDHPETLLVMEKLKWDYLKVRGRILESVCAEHSIDIHTFSLLLKGTRENGRLLDDETLETFDIRQLIGYIIFKHHHHMEEELPRLKAGLQAAVTEEGERFPELRTLKRRLEPFLENFQEHMREEEAHFFPFFALLADDPKALSLSPRAMEDLTAAIHQEDDLLLLALGHIREETGWYRTPEGAGKAYQDLMHRLRLLAVDLRRHMWVESKILYPKVLAVQAKGKGPALQHP